MPPTRVVAALVLGAAACSTSARDGAAFAPPSDLVVTPAGADLVLAWKPRATEDGGAWIELATPGADFVKLAAVSPTVTGFRHPDVATQTTYVYRLVPYFGRASNAVAITTGPAVAAPDAGGPEGPLEPPRSSSGAATSIRARSTIAGAAPVELAATAASPTSVELRWRDRAADEDGVLVEIARDGHAFEVCALLPPDTTSFRKASLAPATAYRFRVRAFFFGEPSAAVSARR